MIRDMKDDKMGEGKTGDGEVSKISYLDDF